MEAEGRTQAWLARVLNVTPHQVWTWVNGLHMPEKHTRDKIAAALGRSPDELWPQDEQAAA